MSECILNFAEKRLTHEQVFFLFIFLFIFYSIFIYFFIYCIFIIFTFILFYCIFLFFTGLFNIAFFVNSFGGVFKENKFPKWSKCLKAFVKWSDF